MDSYIGGKPPTGSQARIDTGPLVVGKKFKSSKKASKPPKYGGKKPKIYQSNEINHLKWLKSHIPKGYIAIGRPKPGKRRELPPGSGSRGSDGKATTRKFVIVKKESAVKAIQKSSNPYASREKQMKRITDGEGKNEYTFYTEDKQILAEFGLN